MQISNEAPKPLTEQQKRALTVRATREAEYMRQNLRGNTDAAQLAVSLAQRATTSEHNRRVRLEQRPDAAERSAAAQTKRTHRQQRNIKLERWYGEPLLCASQ